MRRPRRAALEARPGVVDREAVPGSVPVPPPPPPPPPLPPPGVVAGEAVPGRVPVPRPPPPPPPPPRVVHSFLQQFSFITLERSHEWFQGQNGLSE